MERFGDAECTRRARDRHGAAVPGQAGGAGEGIGRVAVHAVPTLLLPIRAACLAWLWPRVWLVLAITWRWTRRAAVATWRSLRPYGTASWRHPPRGA
jgi:hypothetical protein